MLRIWRARLSLLLAAGGLAVRGAAQDTNAPVKPKSVFETVIPHPTGLNGYEDLVMAGDVLRSSELLYALQQPDVTLEAKRAGLNDPAIKRALQLLRLGLSKPVSPPRDPAKLNAMTVFPEFSEFRNLARMLQIETYVRLADGNVSGAMDSMNDGLRLGHVTQMDTLISGLVGLSIDAISVNLLAQHISQLSLHDSERLEHLCAAWLAVPSPVAQTLEGESHFSQNKFNIKTPSPDSVIKMLETYDARTDEPESVEEEALRERLQQHPEDAGKIMAQAAQESDRKYRFMVEQAKLPAWKREEEEAAKPEPEVAALLARVVTFSPEILDRYDWIQADFHLLGTFAALRRFQWLYDRLPNSLAELRDPEMTLDPYTGKPLLYKREGSAYDLHAVGPFTHEDAKHPFSGPRNPLYLPYRKPQQN